MQGEIEMTIGNKSWGWRWELGLPHSSQLGCRLGGDQMGVVWGSWVRWGWE